MREDFLTGDEEHLNPEEIEFEKALRPLSFSDFTGQQ
jgi:Holliday junction DNA helicase RuvB